VTKDIKRKGNNSEESTYNDTMATFSGQYPSDKEDNDDDVFQIQFPF